MSIATEPQAVAVGTIFVSSWGYEQTNVDFYHVVRMTKTTVTLQRIGATQTETGWATGTVVPDPSKIADHRLLRRKLINGESVRIASYAYANAWNGKPQRYSSYA